MRLARSSSVRETTFPVELERILIFHGGSMRLDWTIDMELIDWFLKCLCPSDILDDELLLFTDSLDEDWLIRGIPKYGFLDLETLVIGTIHIFNFLHIYIYEIN